MNFKAPPVHSSREHPSPAALPGLATPIYLKTTADLVPPSGASTHYLLSRDGLFLCRSHRFFTSCVPAPNWPSELAPHQPRLELRYPKIPRSLIECVVGFFDLIGQRLGSEATVLLAWDPPSDAIRPIVPEQCGLVGQSFQGRPYPISLEYEVPVLPAGWLLIGDIHSHVDMPAFASTTDKEDELHRPGLHLVVGRLFLEPPEFHCEVTIDGHRFAVKDLGSILEDYQSRRPDLVPPEWLGKVQTRRWKYSSSDRDRDRTESLSKPKRGGTFDTP